MGGRCGSLSTAFPGWNDVSLVGVGVDASVDWFLDGVVKILWDG